VFRVSEWIIVGYAAYLLALRPFRAISRPRRIGLPVVASAMVGAILLAASLPTSPVIRAFRTWLPLLYMLVCYWLTGLYFVDPQPEFELRFEAFDRRVREWLRAGSFDQTAPRLVLELLEASYLSCYVMVPAGMLAITLHGAGYAAEGYLRTVLLAELCCYGMLPWIRTRPAWVLHPESPLSKRHVLMRRVSLAVTRNASTCANTFPSGHAAGAVATALAVAAVWPLAGAVFFVLALGIIVGSVVGEYHYAGDAIAGAATGVAAWALVSLV
jgi:membrane-associated phospholipid phosphatase